MPQHHFTNVRRKREKRISESREGIFIIERRKHPRFQLELPLDYSVENLDRHAGVAANASKGGLLVRLSEAIYVGSVLKIEILFAKGSELNSIRAAARVIWSDLPREEGCGQYRYGLKFESFQEGDFRKLKTFLMETDEKCGR